ncbi:MAG: dCTP deaminase, partial [Solirubrobacteraceae bacterium]|nr:dCTP deaminase [Solirubrobacteraceae bacterium]
MTSTSAAGAALQSAQPDGEQTTGVLPAQRLRDAIAREWIVAGAWRIPAESVQPASVDLRLGERAWALRCSFLPDSDSTVEQKAEDLAFEEIDLRDGATLERDRPYLVPLIEELRLPQEIRAKANPKSSTGRLDVFTRVLTDRNHRFDEIAAGYRGKLYLEVVPRTFAIRVKTGLALNQVRLVAGDGRLSDRELLELHGQVPLLF